MISDTKSALSPEDLRTQYERLQADLQIIQNELDQALGVWRTIVSTEKQEFKKLLTDHEQSWDREEAQWQKDREAYEQKIQELESFFNKQLTETEKNAVRALNELDSAWQAERVKWQQTLAQQTKEARQREVLQTASQQQLEQRVAQLEQENVQLQSHHTDTQQSQTVNETQLRSQITELDAQVREWEAEKGAWQQSLTDRINEKDTLIQNLQQELVRLEQRLRDQETTQQSSQKDFDVYIQSLERQITALQELVQQLAPTHPLNRRPNRTAGPPSNYNPFSRAPY